MSGSVAPATDTFSASTASSLCKRRFSNTVEPRFNEVPGDWGNLFVISRVRYIENLDITNLGKKPKCSLYRGIVNIVNNCF